MPDLIPNKIVDGKKFSTAIGDNGMRVTTCCAAISTYVEGFLVCKSCFQEVESGEGDGSERLPNSNI